MWADIRSETIEDSSEVPLTASLESTRITIKCGGVGDKSLPHLLDRDKHAAFAAIEIQNKSVIFDKFTKESLITTDICTVKWGQRCCFL